MKLPAEIKLEDLVKYIRTDAQYLEVQEIYRACHFAITGEELGANAEIIEGVEL